MEIHFDQWIASFLFILCIWRAFKLNVRIHGWLVVIEIKDCWNDSRPIFTPSQVRQPVTTSRYANFIDFRTPNPIIRCQLSRRTTDSPGRLGRDRLYGFPVRSHCRLRYFFASYLSAQKKKEEKNESSIQSYFNIRLNLTQYIEI